MSERSVSSSHVTKKAKKMNTSDVFAMVTKLYKTPPTKTTRKHAHVVPPSLKGAKKLEIDGSEGIDLYERPLPTLPVKICINRYRPRVDGCFSVPISVISKEEKEIIEKITAIKPKDVSSMFGGKPPPSYPTTCVMRDESGEERLYVKRPIGYALWGPANSVDSTQLGKHTVRATRLLFKGTLCDGTHNTPPQSQAVDRVIEFMHKMEPYGAASGMLVAPTGTGKTVMGLAIASMLGPRDNAKYATKRYQVAVICHRAELMVQWMERINEFMPNARVGFVKGAEFDVIGKDVVVIMIDSLLRRAESPEDERAGLSTDPEKFMKAWEEHMSNPRRWRGDVVPKSTLPSGFTKYPAFLLRRFGTVLYDEGHHLAAEGYSKAVGYLPSTYSVTLTATPKRSGQIIPQLFWICGPVIVQFPRSWQKVNLKAIRYENPDTQIIRRKGDLVAVWDMNKDIAYDFERNELIVQEVIAALRQKRHILIFTERVKHSIFLVRRLRNLRVGDGDSFDVPIDPKREQLVGWYTPIYPRSTRRNELCARVVVTTYNYASEGMDVKTLDTLILASPRSEMEQIVGRIFRPCPNKQTPYIVDIYEDFYELYSGMWFKRHRFYKGECYDIEIGEHVVGSGKYVKPTEEVANILSEIPSDEDEEYVYNIEGNNDTSRIYIRKPGDGKKQ